MAEYRRPLVSTLAARMLEPRRFIQMLVGPRQTGKSTAVRQALDQVDLPRHVALASIDSSSRDWLRAQWLHARNLIAEGSPSARMERYRPARCSDRLVVDPPSTGSDRGAYRAVRDDPKHPLGILRMSRCVRLLTRRIPFLRRLSRERGAQRRRAALARLPQRCRD